MCAKLTFNLNANKTGFILDDLNFFRTLGHNFCIDIVLVDIRTRRFHFKRSI